MSEITELTAGQREPLFKLVRFQRESKREIIFSVSQGWDLKIQSWENRATEEEPIVLIAGEIFELWKHSDYIASSERGVGGGLLASTVSTFVLKQEALDYERFMRKPRVIRSVVKLWWGLVKDIPSLVWGIIGGVTSAIITVIILNWLGLTH